MLIKFYSHVSKDKWLVIAKTIFKTYTWKVMTQMLLRQTVFWYWFRLLWKGYNILPWLLKEILKRIWMRFKSRIGNYFKMQYVKVQSLISATSQISKCRFFSSQTHEKIIAGRWRKKDSQACWKERGKSNWQWLTCNLVV